MVPTISERNTCCTLHTYMPPTIELRVPVLSLRIVIAEQDTSTNKEERSYVREQSESKPEHGDKCETRAKRRRSIERTREHFAAVRAEIVGALALEATNELVREVPLGELVLNPVVEAVERDAFVDGLEPQLLRRDGERVLAQCVRHLDGQCSQVKKLLQTRAQRKKARDKVMV